MSKEIKVWQCEKCGVAYINKSHADDCCKEKLEVPRCRVCGIEINQNRTICFDCLEKERYEKGEKIKYSEYDLNWLYDERSERYFSDINDIKEHYEEIDIKLPDWCYGCYEIPFFVDINQALESASEEMYEDFDCDNETVDIKELTDFIDDWNKKQTAKSYYIDYNQIILLNE